MSLLLETAGGAIDQRIRWRESIQAHGSCLTLVGNHTRSSPRRLTWHIGTSKNRIRHLEGHSRKGISNDEGRGHAYAAEFLSADEQCCHTYSRCGQAYEEIRKLAAVKAWYGHWVATVGSHALRLLFCARVATVVSSDCCRLQC